MQMLLDSWLNGAIAGAVVLVIVAIAVALSALRSRRSGRPRRQPPTIIYRRPPH